MIVEYHCENIKSRVFNKHQHVGDDSNSNNNKDGHFKYGNMIPIMPKIYYFLLFYCFGGYRPFVPLFLQHIDFTPSFIGFTLAFPPFISFVSSPIWSAVCDKYKCHRTAVVVSAILSSILLLLLYFVENHAAVFCIILINALFWSPLIPILDSTTLKILGPSRDLYGKQRMYGSIGFAVSATCIGILAQHLNNLKIYWINYPAAMMVYMVLILLFYYDSPVPINILELKDKLSWVNIKIDMIGLNHHKQRLPTKDEDEEDEEDDKEDDGANNEDLEMEVLSKDGNDDDESDISPTIVSPATPSTNSNNNNTNLNDDKLKLINDESKTTTSTTTTGPTQHITFIQSLKILLSNFKLLLFLVNALIVSLGMSMNNNFLGLVIVNDFKGPSSLIGIASILNVTFELVFFFFGKQLLEKWGTKRLIILSHVCLIIRVVGYIFLLSVKASAWAILPVELLHGIIFASIWSAGNRICSDLAPKGLETTSQSLMFAVYLGLGMGIGALLGGSIYQSFGPIVMYTIIAIFTVIGLILFLIFQQLTKNSPSSTTPVDEQAMEKIGINESTTATPTIIVDEVQPHNHHHHSGVDDGDDSDSDSIGVRSINSAILSTLKFSQDNIIDDIQ